MWEFETEPECQQKLDGNERLMEQEVYPLKKLDGDRPRPEERRGGEGG